MKKYHRFVFIFVVSIVLYMVFAIGASAIDNTTLNKLCPMDLFPSTEQRPQDNGATSFPVYKTYECDSIDNNVKERITSTTRCTITKFYTNPAGQNVVRITYSNGTKSGYAKTSRFLFDKSFKPVTGVATAAMSDIALYSGGAANGLSWKIYKDDKLYILGIDSVRHYTQVAYPTTSGYKVAWIKNYTVTFNANGGSGGPSSQVQHRYVNLTLTGEKPTRTGYTFKNWNTAANGSGAAYSAGATYMKNANATLYAQWTINSYTLTVNSADTTMGTVTGGGTFTYNSIVTIKAVSKDGYSFVRWSDGNTAATRNVTVIQAMTLIAYFNANSYTCSFNSNNATMGTVSTNPAGVTFTYNQTVTIMASPNTGYYFKEWNDGNTDNPRTITVYGAMSINAVFEANYYSVTAAASPTEGGTVANTGSYAYGTNITLIARPNVGYKFVQWENGETNDERPIVVSGNSSYEARFEPDPLTCEHFFDEGVVTTPATCEQMGVLTRTCQKCGSQEKEIIAATGHKFGSNWTIETLPTCVTMGSRSRSCLNEGCTEKEEEDMNALGHDYTKEVMTDATCSEPGRKEYYCAREGCTEIDVSKTVVFEALGHQYPDEWTVEIAASCTQEGKQTKECGRCGDTIEEIIEQLPHSYVQYEITGSEYTCGQYCSVCRAEGEIIDKHPVEYTGTLTTEGGYQFSGQSEPVTVSVSISNNPGIIGYKISIEYDESVLEPELSWVVVNNIGQWRGVQRGEAIKNVGGNFIINKDEAGNKITITWGCTGGTTTAGEKIAATMNDTLFSLNFKVKEDAPIGDYSLTTTCEQMIKWNGKKCDTLICPEVTSGFIRVGEVKQGDVNLDAIVNQFDAIALSRHLAHWTNYYNLSSLAKKAADLFDDKVGANEDRKINIFDLVLLMQKIAGYNQGGNSAALAELAADSVAEMCVGTGYGCPGGYVDVPIMLNSDDGISAFKVNLDFDKRYLTPVSIRSSGLLKSEDGQTLCSNLDEKTDVESITIVWGSVVNLNSTGDEILFVRFKISDDAEVGTAIPISVSEMNSEACCISGDGASSVTLQTVNGSVLVRAEPYVITDVHTVVDDVEQQQVPVHGGFDAEVSFYVSASDFIEGELVIACYDRNGKFIGMSTEMIDCNLAASGTTKVFVAKTDAEIAAIKAFFWGTKGKMKPLSNSAELQNK